MQKHVELSREPRLAWAGALLALGEMLCVGQLFHARAGRMLARGGEALCWPMWSGCASWRVLDPGALTALLLALAAATLVAAAMFLARWRYAFALLAINMAALLAVELQDFRLRQNQFYMLAIAVACFTLLPERSRALRYIVVAFYFWAGLLKLNREWLTGAALYKPIWHLDGALLRAGCAWVVVLELVFVFGLLFHRRWLFVFALVQLVLFAIASIVVVGPFYPALMMVLLAACAVLRKESEAPLWLWQEHPSTLLAVALFCALQLIPRMMPGDTALTGEGRLFALHMFDAKVICSSEVILLEPGHEERKFDASLGLPVRTACDPAVLYARGRTVCARSGRDAEVDLHLASRRSSDKQLREIVSLRDFCRQMPEYRWWRHNDWIRAG